MTYASVNMDEIAESETMMPLMRLHSSWSGNNTYLLGQRKILM